MGKPIAAGRRTTPEGVLFLTNPRCIRAGCREKVFKGALELGLCAEHLLETYKAVAPKMGRPRVPDRLLLPSVRVVSSAIASATQSGVYYVDFGEYLKIGYTANIENRMASFRNSHPSPQLLAMEEGARSLESLRHRQFAAYRINRELFRHSSEIRDHIESLGGVVP